LLDGSLAAFVGQPSRELLFASITYAFCLSLIATGGAQMVLTRYLADRLYQEDEAAMVPTCNAALLFALPALLLISPLLVAGPFALRYRLIVVSLFITLSLIWLVSVFLTATMNYKRIAMIFCLSYGVSVVAALLFGHPYGVVGSLAGFTMGQVLCLSLLVLHVYLEFGPSARVDFSFLRSLRRYWDLFLLGSLMFLALWIDNIIYWTSSSGTVISHYYHIFPAYDYSKMFSYLTTIISASVFLVRLETDFYRRYTEYFQCIRERATLRDILQAKKNMMSAARSALVAVAKIQGMATLLVVVGAPALMAQLGLPGGWTHLLQLEVVGASGQFVMLITVLLSLYLDERRAALLVAAAFACANGALTLLTVWLGRPFYGAGYVAATLIGCALALLLLRRQFQQLEYRTFMLQPLS
jgi:uncharacterized membrane protein